MAVDVAAAAAADDDDDGDGGDGDDHIQNPPPDLSAHVELLVKGVATTW